MRDYVCPACDCTLLTWTVPDYDRMVMLYRLECPVCEIGSGSELSFDIAYEHYLEWMQHCKDFALHYQESFFYD